MNLKKHWTFWVILFCFSISLQGQVIDTAGLGEQNVQYGVINTPGSSYFWTVEDGDILSGQGTNFIWVNWRENPGLKKITILETNVIGCISDSVFAWVYVKPIQEYFQITSFTPNQDGLNDFFKPYIKLSGIQNYQFLVQNRWGNILFETQNPEVYWDGSYNGIPLPPDVYVWKLIIETKPQQNVYLNGTITLLK